MNLEKLNSIVIRVFVCGAFLILAVAVFEKGMTLMGRSVFRANPVPHTMLGWSVVLLVFVIALLLIEIRDALKTR